MHQALEVSYNPAQKALDENLRAWRKAEAAKTGKPAFIVFSDSALAALVQAAPQTVTQLLSVSGFGPDKADRYGAAITAICRSEPVRELAEAPAPALKSKRQKSEPQAINLQASHARKGTFPRLRKRGPVVDPESLDADQQALEQRLREWRKAESERMGLPQFFVLGTSTLRTLVMERPRTLSQLQAIDGLGQEKVDRFGSSILAVLNA